MSGRQKPKSLGLLLCFRLVRWRVDGTFFWNRGWCSVMQTTLSKNACRANLERHQIPALVIPLDYFPKKGIKKRTAVVTLCRERCSVNRVPAQSHNLVRHPGRYRCRPSRNTAVLSVADSPGLDRCDRGDATSEILLVRSPGSYAIGSGVTEYRALQRLTAVSYDIPIGVQLGHLRDAPSGGNIRCSQEP